MLLGDTTPSPGANLEVFKWEWREKESYCRPEGSVGLLVMDWSEQIVMTGNSYR